MEKKKCQLKKKSLLRSGKLVNLLMKDAECQGFMKWVPTVF